nr:Chain A, PEPTIDE INHIBITOR [synthetic construct]
DYEPIPEEAF